MKNHYLKPQFFLKGLAPIKRHKSAFFFGLCCLRNRNFEHIGVFWTCTGELRIKFYSFPTNIYSMLSNVMLRIKIKKTKKTCSSESSKNLEFLKAT